MLTFEGMMEELHTNLREGTVNVIKSNKAYDEGVLRDAACRKRPIGDHIELRLGGTVLPSRVILWPTYLIWLVRNSHLFN